MKKVEYVLSATAGERNLGHKLAYRRHVGAQFFEDRVYDYGNTTNDEMIKCLFIDIVKMCRIIVKKYK